jgi:hypothetical protein
MSAAARLRAAQRSCAAEKKSPKIALLAHYNFAQCGVGGWWHACALHACMYARGRRRRNHEWEEEWDKVVITF